MSIHGPGANDSFDPLDLDDVRKRVVLPVVMSVIEPEKLKRVEVGWGPDIQRAYSPCFMPGPKGRLYDYGQDLYVFVESGGRTLTWQIWQPHLSQQLETLADVADDFASRFEQWAVECIGVVLDRPSDIVIPSRD